MKLELVNHRVSLVKLIRWAHGRERQLLVPEVQREFVWGKAEIRSLLASVLAGLPIGSLLFEESDCAAQLPSITGGKSGPQKKTYLILDGRQRTTAMCLGFRRYRRGRQPEEWATQPMWYVKIGRLLGEDGAMTDDPDVIERALECDRAGSGNGSSKEQFESWLRLWETKLTKWLEDKSQAVPDELPVPLPCLLADIPHADPGRTSPTSAEPARRYLDTVGKVVAELGGSTEAVQRLAQRLAKAIVPVQVLRGATPATRRQVFERLNTTGIPLNSRQLRFMRWDLRPLFDKLGKGDGPLVGCSHRELFEVVCSMRTSGADPRDLESDAHAETVRARIEALQDKHVVEQTWQFMRDKWGLASIRDSPSETVTQAVIVLLTEVMQDREGIDRLNRGVLRPGLAAWWWHESARLVDRGGRSAGIESLVADLRERVDASFHGWNEQLDRELENCLAGKLFTGRSADLYRSLLRTEGLPDLEHDTRFNPSRDLQDGSVFLWDIHHVFPKARLKELLPEGQHARMDHCANLTLTTATTNRAILRDRWPSEVLEELSGGGGANGGFDRSSYLKDHGIDLDAVADDDFDEFVKRREEWIASKLRERMRIGK